MGERKEAWGGKLGWDLVEETQGLPGDRTGLFTQPRGREEDFMEEGYPSPNIIQGKQVGVGGGLILGRFQTEVDTQMQRKFTPGDLEGRLYSRGH